MPVEIFYFRDEHGHSAVQDHLKSLGQKAFARSLAQIDLLESGESLPAKIDQAAKNDTAASQGIESDHQSSAQAESEPKSAAPPQVLRYLTSRAGRDRVRYYYVPAPENRLIIVDVVEGRKPRKMRLAKLADRIEQALFDRNASLKSHREYVAESTLGDADLAAQYARARGRAQFALALIRLREAAKYTPESLAERTGLSRDLILSVERGHIPKLGALRRLADALHAQISIAPGSGMAIEPAPRETSQADAAEPELESKTKPRNRASVPKPLPASKTPKPKPNVKSRPAPAHPAPAAKVSTPRQGTLASRAGTRKKSDAGSTPSSSAESIGDTPVE